MLFWGKKRKEIPAGYVADFCPICRTIRKFELKKISLASHVYYVSYGDGDYMGYEATCNDCAYAFSTEISQYTTSGNRNDDLPILISLTFPEIEEVYSDRIEIESIVKTSPKSLPGDLRNSLIREPFLLLAGQTEQIFTGDTRLDWRGMLGCISVFVLPFTVLTIAVAANAEGQWIGWFALAFAVIPLVYTIWLIATSPSERFKNEVVSKLLRALAPLQPTMAELDAVTQLMRPMKLKIVKKVKLPDLVSKLYADAEYPLSSEPIH